MPILDRSEAKKQGLTRYYTGKPCPKGHVAWRHVCNSTCCECAHIYNNTIRKHRSEYKLRHAAHIAVWAAIRGGHIIKPDNCSKCDSTTQIEAHHEDYTKPEDIIWLCQSCHREHHHG